MATHSSVLAWRIPGMGEPGGLPSMRSHRVRHNWSDLAVAAAAKTGKVTIPIIICRGCSAERERQWNFPQQSQGVPRRGEPAVRQPSPSATQSKLPAYKGKQGVLRGTFHSCTNHVKGQIVMCLHYNRSLWWSRAVHVHGNQESQSKVLKNNIDHAPISSARRHLGFRPQS